MRSVAKAVMRRPRKAGSLCSRTLVPSCGVMRSRLVPAPNPIPSCPRSSSRPRLDTQGLLGSSVPQLDSAHMANPVPESQAVQKPVSVPKDRAQVGRTVAAAAAVADNVAVVAAVVAEDPALPARASHSPARGFLRSSAQPEGLPGHRSSWTSCDATRMSACSAAGRRSAWKRYTLQRQRCTGTSPPDQTSL